MDTPGPLYRWTDTYVLEWSDWSPGHPSPGDPSHSAAVGGATCVYTNTAGQWVVTNCTVELPYICQTEHGQH